MAAPACRIATAAAPLLPAAPPSRSHPRSDPRSPLDRRVLDRRSPLLRIKMKSRPSAREKPGDGDAANRSSPRAAHALLWSLVSLSPRGLERPPTLSGFRTDLDTSSHRATHTDTRTTTHRLAPWHAKAADHMHTTGERAAPLSQNGTHTAHMLNSRYHPFMARTSLVSHMGSPPNAPTLWNNFQGRTHTTAPTPTAGATIARASSRFHAAFSHRRFAARSSP